LDRDEEHLAKQFDALVAQLPRQQRRRRLRALPWIVGMGLAIAVLVTLRYTTRPDAATGRAVTYPLAVCGNGLLEPSEDCELSEPGCPADCVRRPGSSDPSATQRDHGKQKPGEIPKR